MTLTFIIITIFATFFFIAKKEKRWMNYGNNKRSRYETVNHHKYYIEEVEFNGYNEALNRYFKIVEEIGNYAKTINEKYDLYDWSSSIFQFEDTTIEIKHLRSIKKVRLIRSLIPISIEDYLLDNPC